MMPQEDDKQAVAAGHVASQDVKVSKDTRPIANAVPLGLCGFALTTFVLSMINCGTRNITSSAITIAPSFAYGGLVQLLAGMWTFAHGDTFTATALSSYGAFWISFAIILTPGGFHVVEMIETVDNANAFADSLGLYLLAWFIFTTMMLISSLNSTLVIFVVLSALDMTYLVLGIGYLYHNDGVPNTACLRAGGAFGLLSAFSAWYAALEGILTSTDSTIKLPQVPISWAEQRSSDNRSGQADNSA